jgi:hypothetical protein
MMVFQCSTFQRSKIDRKRTKSLLLCALIVCQKVGRNHERLTVSLKVKTFHIEKNTEFDMRDITKKTEMS